MLLDVMQASKELSIAPITVRRLVKSGAMPYRRIGSRILFRPEDLLEYIEAVKRPIRQSETAAAVQ